MAIQLIRDETGPDGTFGKFRNNDTGTTWQSIELEWLNNENGVSCIPRGIYPVEWRNHPKHGWCYEVLNVPNRSSILIHAGNWAGNIASGEFSNFEGCIGLGKNRLEMTPPGFAKSQEAVDHSGQSVKEFEAEMNQQPFTLAISNEWPGANQ